ncbi:MAG: hypothetical protein DRP11_03370, partial [Candidatus Aenigmatarchaeota archaeon]
KETKEAGEKEIEIRIPKLDLVNPWKVATFVLLVLFAGYVLVNYISVPESTASAGTVSPDVLQEKISNYINTQMLPAGMSAEVTNFTEEGNLYKFNVVIAGNSYTSYATKDGKLFFVQGIDIGDYVPQERPKETPQPTAEVPKSDKPVANIFVMSYCPFGLQMQKAIIPVMELLGDKANIIINFVDYAMHGKKEIDQNTNEYCIQKEEPEKFVEYLKCFVQSDDHQKCVEEAGVDKEKLQNCIEETDRKFNITGLYNDKSTWSGGRFPPYMVDADLNQQYGVRGSPTFVLNGKVIRVVRSPEAVKEAICNAFNEAPEECNQNLSNTQEAPGIGPLGSGSNSGSSGSCS